MKSPYAHIFTALAEGETEFERHTPSGEWSQITLVQLFSTLQNGLCPPEHLRVKQETININGHDVPAPLKTLPKEGTYVYWPVWGNTSGSTYGTAVGCNDNLPTLLAYGVLHLTKEAASAHAKALISFTEVKS